MDWKKEVKSWGAILAVFAFLYFSGLLPVIQGALQSVLLATGLMKPSIEVPDLTDQKFDYRGQFTDFKGNTIDLQSLPRQNPIHQPMGFLVWSLPG